MQLVLTLSEERSSNKSHKQTKFQATDNHLKFNFGGKMKTKLWKMYAVLVIATLLVTACGGGASTQAPVATEAPAETEPPTVTEEPASTEAPAQTGDKINIGLWTHSAGNPNELEVIQQWVDDFNAQSDKYVITIESFPQASYND